MINWTKLIYGDQSNGISNETNVPDDDDEVGGLFHVTRRKKININDQDDYTLINMNEDDRQSKKHDWDLDEVNN